MTTSDTDLGPAARSGSETGSTSGIERFADIHPAFTHGYLDGVMLAINAVRDICIVVDSPPCAFEKAFTICGTHDLMSSAFDLKGGHRIQCTFTGPDGVIHDRSGQLVPRLRGLSADGRWPVVLVAAMPMATITGVDYEAMLDDAAVAEGATLALVAERSIEADWLDGYAETLNVLARSVKLAPPEPDPRSVAVVGYLFDRNEGDHLGNLRQIEQLCELLSLELVSVWLGGGSVADLAAVGRAGTILSLPYGRQAASELARRTGARHIAMELPLGLRASRHWFDVLGEVADRADLATELANRTLDEVVPVLDVVIDDHLMGKRFGFYGNPHLGRAVVEALHELGCVAELAVVTANAESTPDSEPRELVAGVPTLFCPRVGQVLEHDVSDIDFFVGSSDGHYFERARDIRKPFIELGFPSYRYHCLTERSFLLMKGFVDFVNRIVNG